MSNLTTIYFQLKNLLTEPAYILDLTANQNSQTRNSECAYGGERITIGIAKPGDPQKFITGVDLSLTPYIPRQDLGENKYFDPIKLEEDFVEEQVGEKVNLDGLPFGDHLSKGLESVGGIGGLGGLASGFLDKLKKDKSALGKFLGDVDDIEDKISAFGEKIKDEIPVDTIEEKFNAGG